MNEIIIKTKVTVEVPKVPNFIRVNGDMQNLAYFTDEQLKAISYNWYHALIERKKQQKKEEHGDS